MSTTAQPQRLRQLPPRACLVKKRTAIKNTSEATDWETRYQKTNKTLEQIRIQSEKDRARAVELESRVDVIEARVAFWHDMASELVPPPRQVEISVECVQAMMKLEERKQDIPEQLYIDMCNSLMRIHNM